MYMCQVSWKAWLSFYFQSMQSQSFDFVNWTELIGLKSQIRTWWRVEDKKFPNRLIKRQFKPMLKKIDAFYLLDAFYLNAFTPNLSLSSRILFRTTTSKAWMKTRSATVTTEATYARLWKTLDWTATRWMWTSMLRLMSACQECLWETLTECY